MEPQRSKAASGVDNRKLKELFEPIEISITVQQRVLLAYAERGDQTINRLADRVAPGSQRPIIPCGFPRQVDATCFEHFQLEQLALNILRSELIANTLQNFAENQIDEPQTLAIEFRMEPIGFGIREALQVIDPDRGVDDHHASYFATRPRRDASRSPSHLTLPRRRRMLF